MLMMGAMTRCDQVRHGMLGHQQAALEIDVEALLPERLVQRRDFTFGATHGGIVDQDVEPAIPRQGGCHHAGAGSAVGDIAGMHEGFTAGRDDHCPGFLGALGVQVREADPGPFAGEGVGDGLAGAHAGTLRAGPR
jgi:hypothetical protein